ncbi:MAG: hypothetical protein ACOX7I_03505 [Oscillospiraceae bacterium]|jgi:hypothetical protein
MPGKTKRIVKLILSKIWLYLPTAIVLGLILLYYYQLSRMGN